MGNYQVSTLRPEVMNDLKNSTAFTATEIRTYYKEFRHTTADGRMSIGMDEFKEMYQRFFPDGDSSKFAEYVFLNYDQDNCGRVDFREFLSALSVHLRGNLEEKLEWAFNLFDINDSGYITKPELTNMIKSFRHMQPNVENMQRASAEDLTEFVFLKADLNHDDKLSKEEFTEVMKKSQSIQSLFSTYMKAAGSPFTKRKHPPKGAEGGSS